MALPNGPVPKLSALQLLQHQEEAFKKSLMWCHFTVPTPIIQLTAVVGDIVARLGRDLAAVDLCQREPGHDQLLDGCTCGKDEVYPCRCTAVVIYRIKNNATREMKTALSRCPHFVRFHRYDEGARCWDAGSDRAYLVLEEQELFSEYDVDRPSTSLLIEKK
jgi:hypothetical protein